MKKLDKKQVPQVILLAVLACAVFGWFAYRIITPTPAAASSQAVAAATTTTSAPAEGGTASQAAPADSANQPAPVVPPGPGLRDPFVQAISNTPALPPAPLPAPATPVVSALKPVKVASLPPMVPVVPALPSGAAANWVHETKPAPAAAPAPVVIPPPAWTVTGVLASGSEHVAILRSGEARRFVKKGDALDGLFKVIAVTSDSVVLRHGSSRYVLPLGGGKAAAPALAPAAAPRQAAPAARPSSTPADLTLASPLRAVRIAQAPRVRAVHVALAPRVRAVAKPRRLAVKSAAHRAVRRALCAAALSQPLVPTPSPALVSRLLPVGSAAPDFSLKTLGGGAQSLTQHRGQVVLLHFWSSWDPACQAGLPLMTQLGSDYSPLGFAVLSVNSWDNAAALRPFLSRQGLNAASVLYDPSVANESVAVRLYNASDVSTTYVITPNGDVAARFVGYSPKTLADIRRVLASLGVS